MRTRTLHLNSIVHKKQDYRKYYDTLVYMINETLRDEFLDLYANNSETDNQFISDISDRSYVVELLMSLKYDIHVHIEETRSTVEILAIVVTKDDDSDVRTVYYIHTCKRMRRNGLVNRVLSYFINCNKTIKLAEYEHVSSHMQTFIDHMKKKYT